MLSTSSSPLPFVASKRYYFDDFERNINTENGAITDLDYIFADRRPVALVRTTGGSKICYGVMTDRLGSLMSLYTAEGIVQKFSYDAWGNRRNPLTGAPLSNAELVAANSITSRGYTGHEHIDEFGLINMNARIYDAKLGMFVSVDPQADNYLETYPYAYCGGDPLNRVDLRAMGRSIPYLGYLLLGYDVIHTSWNLGQKYGPFTLYQNYQRNKKEYKSVLLNEK